MTDDDAYSWIADSVLRANPLWNPGSAFFARLIHSFFMPPLIYPALFCSSVVQSKSLIERTAFSQFHAHRNDLQALIQISSANQ